MYKQASQNKLRFQTEKGLLTVEQLWDLPLTVLDRTTIKLADEFKISGKKSFLETKSKKDKSIKLQFDIVLDILNTKVEIRDAEKNETADKQHNAKIDAIIATKQDEALGSKSIKELEKLRR